MANSSFTTNELNEFNNSYNNKKYALAYKIDKKWNITNKLFILNYNEVNNTLNGQFISSMWFSKNIEFSKINDNTNIELAIIEYDGIKEKNEILNDLNNEYYDENIIIYTKLYNYIMKDYYDLYYSSNNCLNKYKQEKYHVELEDFDSNNSILSIRLQIIEKDNNIYINISLPEFKFKLNN